MFKKKQESGSWEGVQNMSKKVLVDKKEAEKKSRSKLIFLKYIT